MAHVRADDQEREGALGVLYRTITEVEDAILQAKARQAYRRAEHEEPAKAREDLAQTFTALNR